MIRLAVLLLLISLAWVPRAGAATITIGRAVGPPDAAAGSLAGPSPAGDAVAYVAPGTSGPRAVIVQRPGAAPRTVATISAVPDSRVVLAASAGAIALTRQAFDCRAEFSCHYEPNIVRNDLFLGGRDGPLRPVTGCTSADCDAYGLSCAQAGDDAQTAAVQLAADGPRVLLRGACSGRTRVAGPDGVHDLGTADAAALSGDHVALVVRPSITAGPVLRVQRLDGGVVFASALPAGAFSAAQTLVSPLVLDGQVALLSAPAGVRIFTAAEPGGRLVPGTAGTTLVGGGAGRFAVRRLQTTAAGVSTGVTRIDVLALDGRPVRGFDVADRAGTVGFDGTTLTYAQRRCVLTTVTAWRVGDPAPAVPPTGCGTPAVSTRAAVLRGSALSLRVTCPATASAGCQGSLTATARRAGPLAPDANAAERLYRLGTAPVALDPGETAGLVLRPSAGARRFARRHARGLRLLVTVRGTAAAADRPPGDRGSTRAQAPLRVAQGRTLRTVSPALVP